VPGRRSRAGDQVRRFGRRDDPVPPTATTTWLLRWYVIWLLPIAALTGDRKLRIATIMLCAFVIGMRLPYWLARGAHLSAGTL
jgi:hypothetical protein